MPGCPRAGVTESCELPKNKEYFFLGILEGQSAGALTSEPSLQLLSSLLLFLLLLILLVFCLFVFVVLKSGSHCVALAALKLRSCSCLLSTGYRHAPLYLPPVKIL